MVMRSAVITIVLLGFVKLFVVASDEERQQATTTMEHDKIVQMYKETSNKIAKWGDMYKECRVDDYDTTKPPIPRIERIKHLPPESMVGVDHDMLHLCATVAGGVYEASSRANFEKLLKASQIRDKFPDLTVRFFQNGVTLGGRDWFPERLSLNAPTFVGLITESTLVLGWRGTVTIKDVLADAKIDSVAPWSKELPGLEVQQAYYNLIKDAYFKSHARDIENYVKGNYSKRPNQTKKDGTPITRIILTGHSLGGGLAQVAHLCLRAPGGGRWTSTPFENLGNTLKDVQVKTIAISAPMTTVLNKPSSTTTKFLQDVIEPDMRNVVFSADVVPRGYSDLEFINGFVNAFLDDTGMEPSSLADQFARAFVKLHINIFKKTGMMEQAEKYRHVGKLIYYEGPNAMPVLYADTAGEEKSFRDLRYGPKTKVADTALENHGVLVTDTGLVYQTQ